LRFQAPALESAFQVGRNVVGVFLVSGPASSVQLLQLPTSLSG
jgi:hypothetical protein